MNTSLLIMDIMNIVSHQGNWIRPTACDLLRSSTHEQRAWLSVTRARASQYKDGAEIQEKLLIIVLASGGRFAIYHMLCGAVEVSTYAKKNVLFMSLSQRGF